MNNSTGHFHEANENNRNRHEASILDKKLVGMLFHAAQGKSASVKCYNRLNDMLIASDDRVIVHDIMLDEVKHRRMFEELIYSFTGQRPDLSAERVPEEEDARAGLPMIFERYMLDKLKEVEFCRQIYFALINLEFRDVLFEIILDEQRHAVLLNHLYTKYAK